MKRLCIFITLFMFLPTPIQAKIKLNKTSLNLLLGDTYTLKVKGTKKKAKWSSSNKKIVSVSKKGVIKALKEGKATIKVKVNKKTYKCKVTVPTVKLNSTNVNILSSDTYQLSLNTKKKVVWKSLDTNIATVNNGKVTPKDNYKQVKIQAVSNNKTYTCTVNIGLVNTTVGTTQSIYSLMKAKSGYTFKTENQDICQVSTKYGLLMPLHAGSTMISMYNGSTLVNQIKVNVKSSNVQVVADISKNNGTVDFNKLKENHISKVILRGGYGSDKDTMVDSYIDSCISSQMDYDFYWVLTSSNAVNQAKKAIEVIGNKDIYIDLEANTGITKDNIESQSKLFINTLINNGISKKRIHFYANKSYYAYMSKYFSTFTNYWCARYNYSGKLNTVTINNVSYKANLWQVGDDFKVNGMSSYCDLNYLYGE